MSFAIDLAASINVTRVGLLLRLTPARDHFVSIWLVPATLAFGTDSLGDCGGGCAGDEGRDANGRGASRVYDPLSADCAGDGFARLSGSAILRAFIDKSVIEVFCGGGAIRVRDFPAAPAAAVGIAPFAEGAASASGVGVVEAWAMGSMWA